MPDEPPQNPDSIADITVDAAIVHHQAGRLDQAEALYRKALEEDPQHADALHLLGAIALQRGDIGSAIALIERALPDLDDLPEAHLNLGNALMAAGRHDEAVDSFRRGIALDPDYGMAHNNLALVLIGQGKSAAGLEHARRAFELIPDFPGARVNYISALLNLERFAEVEAPLRAALGLDPGNAKLLSALGRVLSELGRRDEALVFHDRALALDPKDAEVHLWRGRTQYQAGDLEGSEASLRHAVAISPEFANAWRDLGVVLAVRGRFAAASACLSRALELAPHSVELRYTRAMIGRRACDESEINRLHSTLANTSAAVSDRIVAGFALAGLFDTAERYDEAFLALATANTLHRQRQAAIGESFDPALLHQHVEGLVSIFTPELFPALAGWGNPSQLPVFIVGMPRSGTTLVEQIAASHSLVFGAGERKDMPRLAATLTAHGGKRPVSQWDANFIRQLADDQVASLQKLGAGAARVITKLPDNILLLGLIAALFPAARVIFCRRDARDTCLSCYFQRFDQGHRFAYDLEDCGRNFLEIDRLAAHWLNVLPLSMLVIDYEKLVEDLEGESRRLIEFLGLEWEPGCLEFHQAQRPIFTASLWQVRQPIYSRSVGRWRKYEKHLGPLLAVLAKGGAIG